MRMIYNGVDLMPIETHMMDIEPVYDDTGTDYLYTRFSASVRAMVSGQLVGVLPNKASTFITYKWGVRDAILSPPGPAAYDFRASPTLVPPTPFGAGVGSITTPQDSGVTTQPKSPLREIFVDLNSPPLTHQVIRHRLTTPRGKLYVFSGPGVDLPGGVTPTVPDPPGGRPIKTGDTRTQPPTPLNSNDVLMMLEAPEEGYVCDCKNGPLPRLLGIHVVEGDMGVFVVDFSIEAYFNESEINSVDPTGSLLSNRFSQTHTVAEDGFTNINTQGKAIFRTDKLYEIMNSANPDYARPLLFMPILQGFTRVVNYVTGLPDVTGVSYGYTDTQVKVNFPAGPYVGAALISAVHSQSIVSNTELAGSLMSLATDVGVIRRSWRERDRANERDTDSEKTNFRKRANRILRDRI